MNGCKNKHFKAFIYVKIAPSSIVPITTHCGASLYLTSKMAVALNTNKYSPILTVLKWSRSNKISFNKYKVAPSIMPTTAA